MAANPELSNPLRKFKLVFLGEQSGKIPIIPFCRILTLRPMKPDGLPQMLTQRVHRGELP
ncbi:hypothetical protein BC938DRAFT_471008 [Jimgerdemannia flammicorona]|uniref:Uncharacterized protein n=1 Tax=Jimgerdemannia flammicorona TaxID=994334 RepID=A0A433Q903_9FUNG|nr:hypothetical protein BC938DRAFT_471008 [Jimgerdemannia flammicorona]